MAVKYKVETPNPHFTGVRAGVAIERGKGEFEGKEKAKHLEEFGYKVEKLNDKSSQSAKGGQKEKSGSKDANSKKEAKGKSSEK